MSGVRRVPHRPTDRYAGLPVLLRAALRRDRVLVPVWTALLVLVVYASAAATAGLYPTLADRVAAARAINTTPAVVALYGPVLDETSLGELAMTKLTVLYALAVALLVLVVVRRHTRVDEESGHAELLGGTAVGRDAVLGAAVAEGLLVSILVGALAALADVVAGLPVAGSVVFGATWTGVGLVATGLTAVACQLSASSRTCAGIAGGALAAIYAVRAVADVGPTWLGWLSPLGWSTRISAWSDPRWWVLLLHLATTAVLLAVAGALRAGRDLGSGVIGARPGPAHGSPRLGTAVVLAWRVHRTSLWAWTAAVAALGGVMGAIAPSVGSLLDTEAGRRMIESLGGIGALQDALVAAVLSIAAIAVTAFALGVVAHGGTDERDGRTEQVLATATSRSRSLLATAAVALGGATWLLAVCGLGIAVGLGTQAGEGAWPGVLGAALDQAPAVWVLTGLALLLYALRRSWAVLGWAALAGCLLLGQVGELLSLPAAVTGLSPYSHVPAMPTEPFAAAPAAGLTAVAALLLAAAWWRFRERDLG